VVGYPDQRDPAEYNIDREEEDEPASKKGEG